MKLLYIALLIFFFSTTSSTRKGYQKTNIQPLPQQHNPKKVKLDPNVEKKAIKQFHKLKNQDADALNAKFKAKILQEVRNHELNLNKFHNTATSEYVLNFEEGKGYYHMDPVLNQIRRYNKLQSRRRAASSSSSEASSSREFRNWREEFHDFWSQKKFEAVNSSDLRGDAVNMLAARPAGVPCGDPNQHDVPWGNCMLPMECDAEYRIYRGDYFCGNTQYVCCALQISTYDLNQAIDISFADSSFQTDSEELKNQDKGSKEGRKKKKKRHRKKRKKDRRKRKREIKKTIKRIVHEIKKILHRSYRNSTQYRKRRTKLLKRYIQDLKKQYIKDRNTVRDIHREDMIKVDNALMVRLNHIRDINKNFAENSTFRDIIVHGKMTAKGARMLVEAYPDLSSYLPVNLRRARGDAADRGENEEYSHLEYDIEYGPLYY